MDKPILILQKNIEKKTNKIRLPKIFTDKHKKETYMEVYEDYIKIIPIRKEK